MYLSSMFFMQGILSYGIVSRDGACSVSTAIIKPYNKIYSSVYNSGNLCIFVVYISINFKT